MCPFSKPRCPSLKVVPTINDFTGAVTGSTAIQCERKADGHEIHYLTPRAYSPLTGVVEWRDCEALGFVPAVPKEEVK